LFNAISISDRLESWLEEPLCGFGERQKDFGWSVVATLVAVFCSHGRFGPVVGFVVAAAAFIGLHTLIAASFWWG